MTKTSIWLLGFLSVLLWSCGQRGVEKTMETSLPDTLYEQVTFDTSLNKFGSYLKSATTASEKGVIVLFPGFWQEPSSVYQESDLPQHALAKGFHILVYPVYYRFTADSVMRDQIDRFLSHAIVKNGWNDLPFYFGGFSAGGTVAVRYGALCAEAVRTPGVVPKAIFAIDPPLDMFRHWEGAQELLKISTSEPALQEATGLQKVWSQLYGGTPDSIPERYHDLSAISMDTTMGRNELPLSDIAIRMYHDVDIVWRLKERGQAARYQNFIATSELIRRLNAMGNEKAEFIQTFGNGFRADGRRHPHSWSVLDAQECVEWLLGL